ncbi:MAG: hypothetical protein MK105_10405 [Crocinitomicaceae bacterium]|nr:hypothetical protein [Crocinitomicaceae bacterium]
MKRQFALPKSILYIGVPLLMFTFLVVLMMSSLFDTSSILVLGVSIDLLILVPLIYFLLIRKTEVPKTTVVPIIILGLSLGYFFMPESAWTYLNIFKIWVLPLIELLVLVLVFLKLRKLVRFYRQVKGAEPDFYNSVKKVCAEFVQKRVVYLLAAEISVLYYGFWNWKKRTLAANEFSNHKESGIVAIFWVIILMVLVESFVLHLLLARWSVVFAWILTILSIYTSIQLFGFVRSISKRPIVIDRTGLTLRCGLMNEVKIPLDEIDSLLLSQKELEDDDELTRTLSPLGKLEQHNVVLILNRENELTGVYGGKKPFNRILFYVDKPMALQEVYEKVLSEL